MKLTKGTVGSVVAGTALSALVLGVPTAAADVVRVDAHPGLSYTWTPERGFEESSEPTASMR
ncbi:hypothetical protein RE943_46030 [Prescottella equi]|nr:hypothetical protein RE943_46030 [Prescottella equi]